MARAKAFKFTLPGLSPENPIEVAHRVIDKPNPVARYQAHTEYEIGVVLKGRYRQNYRQGNDTCGPGDIWFAGAWELHSYDVLVPQTELVVIMFLPSVLFSVPEYESEPLNVWLPFLRPEIRSEFGKRSEASQLRIATICQALIDELEKPSNGSRFCTRLLVWNLLAEVVREHRPGTKTIPLQSASTMQKMQNVMHYVTENLSGSITFREACKRSGLGSTQFVKRCKDIFGMTFFQYVTSCRLEAARNEILNSKEKLKIEYVAKRWGFYDASHFLRAYRKQYGHGPVQEQAQR